MDVLQLQRTTNSRLRINGGLPLKGEYPVQGNKNAALPLIAASLLSRGPVRLEHLPRIRDVENLIKLLECIGIETRQNTDHLQLQRPERLTLNLPDSIVEKLRGAILLLGAIAPEIDEIECLLPGGCPIGRRSFDVHWRVFEAAGFSVEQSNKRVAISRRDSISEPLIYLEESSVTATENALILFAGLGSGMIQNPAREPHILDLVDFLRELGCEIELHPLYYRIHGNSGSEEPTTFRVPADYIDAGTMAIASAVTQGNIVLDGVEENDLMGILPTLEQFGIAFEWVSQQRLRVIGTECQSPSQLKAGPWPLFPTDLTSLAIVLATQSTGLCLVHDWMYESRMFFVDKLVRMGARITMCDPHRVLVEGPASLSGTQLESPDIRAGMALVVAGLCAKGTTEIEHAEVIRRGYEDVAERLRALGADVVDPEENR